MPDTLTPERLAEIRQRAEAVAGQEWFQVTDGPKGPKMDEIGTYDPQYPEEGYTTLCAEVGDDDARRFIIAAREDVPALLAEVERLRDAERVAWGLCNNYIRRIPGKMMGGQTHRLYDLLPKPLDLWPDSNGVPKLPPEARAAIDADMKEDTRG